MLSKMEITEEEIESICEKIDEILENEFMASTVRNMDVSLDTQNWGVTYEYGNFKINCQMTEDLILGDREEDFCFVNSIDVNKLADNSYELEIGGWKVRYINEDSGELEFVDNAPYVEIKKNFSI